MSFKKRVLQKSNILINLDNIMNYLDVDAFYITDDFSRQVVKLYNEGKSEQTIKEYILNHGENN